MAENRQKLQWINVMKGIGILLTILEHCLPSSDSVSAKAILIFHMPLFFFVSGYCFDADADKELHKRWIRRSAEKSIIIYFLFSALGFFWYLVKGFFGKNLTARAAVTNLINIAWCNQVRVNLVGGVCGLSPH